MILHGLIAHAHEITDQATPTEDAEWILDQHQACAVHAQKALEVGKKDIRRPSQLARASPTSPLYLLPGLKAIIIIII